MTVATYTRPNYTSHTASAYKGYIDGAAQVYERAGNWFAPHAQSSPNMTVRLDAGWIWNGTALAEVAAQSSGTITAPVTNPRIDRIVVDAATGAVSIIAGAEAASPAAPALTAGKIPIAQVLLATSSTTITNSMLTDERVLLTTQTSDLAEASIASAGTVAIGAAASRNVLITGTTTITAFDTVMAGITRKLRFNDALTLTHHGTSLILPGGANITTAANDSCEAISLGSGNWKVRFYQRQDGTPVAGTGVTSAVAGVGITVSGATGAVTISQDIYTGSTASNLAFPVGSYVLVTGDASASAKVMNSSVALYLVTLEGNANSGVSTAVSGTALTGTWRKRGEFYDAAVGTFPCLYQRTA